MRQTTAVLLLCAFFSSALSQCLQGYSYDANIKKCYKVFTDPANYFTAEVYCNRDGGFLATASNAFVNSFIGGLLSVEGTYYIGLNKLMSSEWRWVDGTPFGYSNWASGQTSSNQCAGFIGGVNQWSTVACDTILPYICMTVQTSDSFTTTPPVQNTRQPLCEEGWFYFSKTDSCYRTFTAHATSITAEMTCSATPGAHLASIHSDDERYFVSELSATGLTLDWPNQVLIGLILRNNSWTWTDGSQFDYQVWTPGSPIANQTNGFLYADEWDQTSGFRYKFSTIPSPADILRAFVCKKASISQQLQTTRRPLCDNGWTYFNTTNACYKTFTETAIMFGDAEATCSEASGGHLTSIHSDDERYFVSEISATGMTLDWPQQVLIGLFNKAVSTGNDWHWTDGTPFDYSVWGSDAPGSGKPYGYIYADEWIQPGFRLQFDSYINPATVFRAFVCKKPPLY